MLYLVRMGVERSTVLLVQLVLLVLVVLVVLLVADDVYECLVRVVHVCTFFRKGSRVKYIY